EGQALLPRVAREALRLHAGGIRLRAEAAARRLPRRARAAAAGARAAPLPLRPRPGLRRLHRLRRVPVGAMHVADPAARARRPDVRLARAPARSLRRLREEREGLSGLGLEVSLVGALPLALLFFQRVQLLVNPAKNL